MSRIDRKNIDSAYMALRGRGGLTDAFDDMIKSVYRVSDDEYDVLCEILSNEEMDELFMDKPSFTQKRRKIEILNKYLKY